MMKLLICISLIVLPLIAGAEVREPPGCWKRIRTVSIYDDYAKYAVSEHNERTKERIVFVRILSGRLQLDYGTRYYFIIEGKNGDGKTMKYEAIVFERISEKYIRVESFRPY